MCAPTGMQKLRVASIAMLVALLLAGCTRSAPEDADADTPTATGAATVSISEAHSFLDGTKMVTFEVSAATSADATLWFEGVFAREPVLAIRILDPSGQVVLESESPDGYVGGAVGGTSFRVAQRVTLSPAGTWSIAFEGRGSPLGHAEIRT